MASLNVQLREAVKDYVDELLIKRGGSRNSSRGLDLAEGVTPEEILVAARAAGQKASRSEAVALATGGAVNLPQNGTKMEDGSGPLIKPPADCSCGPAEGNDRVLHRKDYHWSVWKTSPTPQPGKGTPLPRPPSAARSEILHRSGSIMTPDPFRTPSVRPALAWEDYPGGMRTPTPVGRVGAPTPSEMKADSRDVLAEPQTAPVGLALQKLKESHAEENATAMVPALKAWVSNANDYERDVAFNLLQSINGGTSTRAVKDCFRTGGHRRAGSPGGRATFTYQRARTAGVRTKPAHLTAPHVEQKYLNVMGRSMQQARPMSVVEKPQALYGSSLRPMARHTEVNLPLMRDYTHEASMFMNSQRPYRSNFTVHPEWVSENPDMKRNMSLMKHTKGSKGFRYTSK